MAKLIGLFQFSGKLGQTVGLKGANGENYVRILTKPTNKSSQAQVDSRVKMTLAGLLSKLTSQDLIIGMGNTTRNRRNRFTSNIARGASVTTDATDGTVRAQLAPEDLIFSEGRLLEIPEGLSTTYNGTSLSVNFNGDLPEGTAALLVIGAFSNGNEYIKIDGALITDSQKNISIPGGAEAVNVYAIPIVRAENVSNTTYQRVVEDIDASNDYAAVASAALAGNLYYGASVYQNRVTPA